VKPGDKLVRVDGFDCMGVPRAVIKARVLAPSLDPLLHIALGRHVINSESRSGLTEDKGGPTRPRRDPLPRHKACAAENIMHRICLGLAVDARRESVRMD
jgi:hypothetical protein